MQITEFKAVYKKGRVRVKNVFTVHKEKDHPLRQPRQTLSYLTIVQYLESLFCDVESCPDGVDGGNDDRHARRRVGQYQLPAVG